MRHQQEIVDVALEIDPDTGYLAYDELVFIGPRQVSGKTELLLPLMTYRCLAFDDVLAEWVYDNLGKQVAYPGPQRVLYTAQAADMARLKWRDVHLARLEKSAYKKDFVARLAKNSEQFTFRNGSTWSPAAPTGSASGTGDTIDMAVIDEAWYQQDARTELGMRPAMLTRPWRQFVITSMIPGLSRAMPGTWRYLERKRELGRQKVENDVRYGMAFFDFAASPDADPADPATWWSCMPGLGYTASERAVASDFESTDLVDFCAEYLGWAPTSAHPRWSLLPRELWGQLHDPDSTVASAPVLAAEISDDRTEGCIAVCGKRADGDFHWEIVEPGQDVPVQPGNVDWMVRRIKDIYKKNKATTVVVDPARPASSLIVPLVNAGLDVTKPNARDVASACGRWYDSTGANPEAEDAPRGHHIGQPELDKCVASARKLEVGNGQFVFIKRGHITDIYQLHAVVLAQYGFELKGRALPRSRVY